MKARYIRDWIKGSTLSTNNVWREINVIRKYGTNVAQGKTPSSNGTFNASYPAANATDNNINTYAQINGTTPATSNYIRIDLGQVYNDIDYIQIWHDYADGRTFYGTKTEISVDGATWTTIYDSATMGTYEETIGGKTHSQRRNRIAAEVNRSKAITDNFGTRVNGGLISTVITEYRELDSPQVTGLISGIQGTNKDLPFLVAGGTYNDALSGTAKAIIRHDGSVKFTDGEFHGTIYATDGEFHGTIYATDGEFTGTVNSTSGNIGGFSIGTGSLQAISGSNSMLLSSNLVRFLGQYSSVYIGADTFPSSGGGAILGTQRIEINRTVASTARGNVGIYFDIKGSTAYDDAGYQYTGNHAIYAVGGDYAGFRLRTRRVSTSQTLSDMDNVIICTNSATITLTLPSSPKDGQIYIITSISSGYFIIKVGNTSDHIIFRTQSKTHTQYQVDTGRDRLFFLIWDKVNLIWTMGQTSGW